MPVLISPTRIEWATHVWNPVHGCLRGCPYCYAKKIASRYFNPSFTPEWVEKSYRKTFPINPAIIFVSSMSDIEYWEQDWIEKVLKKISDGKYNYHIFIFLTKCPEIFELQLRNYKIPKNVKIGLTIDGTKIPYKINPEFDFLNFEPLIEEVTQGDVARLLLYTKIRRIIIGAQTNPYREIPIRWIRNITYISDIYGLKLFVKNNVRNYPVVQCRDFWK